MPQDLATALYPAVAFQLVQLVAAGLVVAAGGLAMWAVRRRLGGGAAMPAAAGRERGMADFGRLTVALLLVVLCLLLTLGLRQLWPHPGLRSRCLAVLLITLVTVALTWWRQARREGVR